MHARIKIEVSIYIRIILGFFAIIIPLYALNYYTNILGAGNMKDEILNSTRYQVNYHMDLFDNEIKRISEMQGLLLNDPEVQRMNLLSDNMDTYQRMNTIKNIQTKILMLKNISPNITQVTLFLNEVNMILNKGNEGYSENINSNELYSSMNFKHFGLFEEGSYIYLNTTSEPLSGNRKTSLSSIRVLFDKKTLVDSLLDFSINFEGFSVLINLENNWLISNDPDEERLSRVEELINGKGDTAELLDAMPSVHLNKESYVLVCKKSVYLNTYLVTYIPENKLMAPVHSFTKWFWIISAAAFFLVTVFSYWIYNILEKPLMKLSASFQQVEKGDLDVSISHKSNNEFKLLYIQFNKMVANLKYNIREMYEHRIRLRESELKQLQYQINPHFLYNTLFIIYRMAGMKDHDSVMHLSHHLSNYYKFLTKNVNDEISLEKEVDHVKDYVEIQTVRVGKRIHVEMDVIPGGLEEIPVPRLILQPVVENVYNHGLKNKLSEGILRVLFRQEENFLRISVEDNGDELTDDKLSELMEILERPDQKMENSGLVNVHGRLTIKYGSQCGIKLSRSSLGGLKVEMNIQIPDSFL